MANNNVGLGNAKVNKKDEFYTQLQDIANEMRHYVPYFKDKTVLCNCDDPRVSNFFQYFALKFETLGLKKLITTCYKNQQPDLFSEHKSERAIYLVYEGDKNGNKIPDPEERKKVLDYKLTVYVCSGTDTEKLKWFETINIAGKELTKQELRNAVYYGSFVTDAKRYFSKNNCAAYKIGGKYLVSGSPIRQDYLETALKWICQKEGYKDIRIYMNKHQKDTDALELYNYYHQIIMWVMSKFDVAKRTKYLKGADWGMLYERFHKDKSLNKTEIEKEFSVLLKDSEVENKKGIPYYILLRDERYLGLRTFGDDVRERVYDKQDGICPICREHFDINEMEADHIIPWSKGGKTEEDNCQMLCMKCNRTKSDK